MTNLVYFKNLTDTFNSTNPIVSVMQYANSVTDNIYGLVMLFVVWAVVFISLSSNEKSKVIVVANFFTWLVAVIFWAVGTIGFIVVAFMTFLLVGSIGYLMYAGRNAQYGG